MEKLTQPFGLREALKLLSLSVLGSLAGKLLGLALVSIF